MSPLSASAASRLRPLTAVAVGACLISAALSTASAQADFGFLPGAAGFDGSIANQDGSPSTQAGSHPYEMTIGFGLNTHLDPVSDATVPDADPKDIEFELPPGLVVNPQASETTCTESQLESDSLPGGGCPDSAAVGTFSLDIGDSIGEQTSPLYNMAPPSGASSEFGFDAGGAGVYVHIFNALPSGQDGGLSAKIQGLVSLQPILGGSLTFWGDPSDQSHDAQRGGCLFAGGACPVDRINKPFLTLPGSCSGPLRTTISADSWEQPGAFVSDSYQTHDSGGNPVGISGCSKLDFTPTIAVTPGTQAADSPTGLSLDLHLPQSENAAGLAEANLKKATVTLPEGLTLDPSGSDGLGACSAAQIELQSPGPPACPDNSKIGSVEASTPLLGHPAPGSVYLAKPGDNPYGSLLAIYVVIDDPQSGIVVKFAGQVEPDPQSGQLTTVFDNAPRLPFSDLDLDFFGGPRGPFRTPTTCGTYTTTTEMVPWSAADPDNPTAAETATPSSSFQITEGPSGAPCANAPQDRPSSPTFSAGTEIPLAGTFSPFTMTVSRSDGSQEMHSLELTLPPGLTGKLAGVSYCPEAAIAAAAETSGIAEEISPSCPPNSKVGHLDIRAGAGPDPLQLVANFYLAGPFKGAPLSMVVITPVVSGPFDLGTNVNRSTLSLNPSNGQAHVVTEPFPQIFQGIPTDTRSLTVHLDRDDFVLNPTSCNPMTLSANLAASSSIASLSAPFQVGGCGALGFSPKLSVDLSGGTRRAKHPTLSVTITQPAGQANSAASTVTLPLSEQVDNSHLKMICTHVQFAANACPPESIYGEATAISPLLDEPLSGPVYLASGSHPLPDLLIALRGQISLNLRGEVESVGGRLRTTFSNLPDAPLSQFKLTMQGGGKGLLVNDRNICARAYRAAVLIEAQDGSTADQDPVIGDSCGAGARQHNRDKKRRSR